MSSVKLTQIQKESLEKELRSILAGFESADTFNEINIKVNVVTIWEFSDIVADFELETKRKGIGGVQTQYKPRKAKYVKTLKAWLRLCISEGVLRAKNNSYKGTILEYKPKKLNKVLDSEVADEGYVYFRGSLVDSKVNTIGLPASKICWMGDQLLTFHFTKYKDVDNYDVEFDIEIQAYFTLYDENNAVSYRHDKMKYIITHLDSDGEKFKHLEKIVIVLPKQVNVSRKKIALEIVRHILQNFSKEKFEKANTKEDWKKFYDKSICEAFRSCFECRFYMNCEDWIKELEHEVVKIEEK